MSCSIAGCSNTGKRAGQLALGKGETSATKPISYPRALILHLIAGGSRHPGSYGLLGWLCSSRFKEDAGQDHGSLRLAVLPFPGSKQLSRY